MKLGFGTVTGAASHPSGPRSALTVAVLPSAHSWEEFYERQLGFVREQYTKSWRNGWVWSYCRMLQANGVQPLIYIPSLRQRGITWTHDGVGFRLLPLGPAYRPWARLPALQRSPPGRYVAQVVNTASLLPALRGALLADGIDALLAQEYWTARFDLLARRLRVPLVAIDQGLASGREIQVWKDRAFRSAAAVVTQTQPEADRLNSRGARTRQITNGVDTAFWSPDKATVRDRFILTAARLNDGQKRTSDLIRALVVLGPEWRLRIAGDGPDAETLAALAEHLGVDSRIDFLGQIESKETLRSLYRACGVFALPSAREGLPLALLEAMSCAAAVVGTDIPAIAEVVADDENGLLVPVGAPDALAAAIAQAWEVQARLGGSARQTVDARFSELAVGAQLAELVASVGAGGGSSARARR